MNRRSIIPAAVTVLGLLAMYSGCNPAKTDGNATLNITLTPSARVAPDGTTVNVLIAALDANGKAGTGTVTLSVGVGTLGAGGTTGALTLANGQATTTYSCNAASDPACTGTVKLAATWNTLQQAAAIQLVVPGEDAGHPGGNKDGGTPDGGITPTGVPAQMTFVNTSCNGVTGCTVMGVKGSGFNEQAQVFFKVTDSANVPVANQPVTFSLTNPPAGTNVSGSGTTDSNGIVSALITSGQTIGATSVHAQASVTVSAVSSTIGIRGGKPANKAFLLQCTPVNVPTFISATPPAIISIPCSVALLDRFNNPVGTGTAVYFKTEVGNITNSVNTQAYQPNQTAGEGTATVPFSTQSQVYLPTDVAPLAAAPGQYPFARDAEPSVSATSTTNNPRDSLVSVLAYVTGEEYYDDANNNGVYDTGESFIDQGEPLVDNNDNGIWDPGEIFLDVNQNGKWDKPNGVYDSNTTIWTEARILYTGRAVAANSFFSTTSNLSCNAGVPVGGFIDLGVAFLDSFLNYVSNGSGISVMGSGAKGSVSVTGSTGTLDSYGFRMERRLVNAANGNECTSATPICQWRTLFGTWAPYTTTIRVTGTTTDDMMGCKNNTVTVGITEQNVTTQRSITVGVY